MYSKYIFFITGFISPLKLFTDTVSNNNSKIRWHWNLHWVFHMTFSHIQNKLYSYPSRDVVFALENPDNICGEVGDGRAQQA